MSRHERVAIERPGVKSLLAFFLLPQFWRSMEHFKHIGPVFTRTLALMLVQSGLLPLNHTAIHHGRDVEGNRLSPAALMGEAWYYLRTRRHMGIYQWGLFISLVLMFASLIGSAILSAFYFLGTSVANAQLFQHPGPGATNIVSTATTPGDPMFNRMAPGTTAGTTQDLAISILDRVLRQPANGTGGTMQVAIGPMLGTYSTAVLVIASLVIFWSIMSLVIDSARTGQLGGGGRHNMVWTPIRFVFALGILVPVGGAFNTGQILVLKLAEWGSNLGTNMWGTYVQTAVDPTLLATGVRTSDPTAVIKPLMDALVCAKSHNMASEVSLGTANFNPGTYDVMNEPFAIMGDMDVEHGPAIHPQYIREIMDQKGPARFLQSVNFSYGNESSMNLCGSVELPNPNARDLVYQGPPIHNLTQDPGGGPGTPFDVSSAYKQAVRNAEWIALNTIKDELMAFACHLASVTQAAPPADYPNTCTGSPHLAIGATTVTYNTAGCNVGPVMNGGYGGEDPPKACWDNLTQQYANSRNAAINAAHATLSLYFADNGPFETESIRQGWAGMGSWYYTIAAINRGYASSRTPETTIEGGPSLTETRTAALATAAREEECSGFWASIGCGWDSFTTGVGNVVSGAVDAIASVGGAVVDGWTSLSSGFPISGIPTSIEDGKLIMRWALKKMEVGDGGLLVNIGGYGSQTHPMSSLAMAGSEIIDKSFVIYGALAFISLFAGIPYVGGAVEALMQGPVGALLGTVASFGLVPGMMLLYYVPMIPWLKVMFAVLAWIVSVIEAVITIPIVALAHMRTGGEGLMGDMAKGAYINWLNLLLRPGLVVVGFVMGNAVFESMILYMNDTYNNVVASMGSGGYGIIDQVVNTYIYTFTAYALVNASFKLVDIIPNSTFNWLGGRGSETFAGEARGTEDLVRSESGQFAGAMSDTAHGAAVGAGLMAGGAAAASGAAAKAASKKAYRKYSAFRRLQKWRDIRRSKPSQGDLFS